MREQEWPAADFQAFKSLLVAGATDRAIRDALGKTIGQVAGKRWRVMRAVAMGREILVSPEVDAKLVQLEPTVAPTPSLILLAKFDPIVRRAIYGRKVEAPRPRGRPRVHLIDEDDDEDRFEVHEPEGDDDE